MAPRRRRCTICGSKQWHKEPSSGVIACSEGHILQNYRNEATEADAVDPHVLRKRAIKSMRVKKGRESKADPKLYHGARGRYHYFQCQQLLLRKQIVALTRLWKLPTEFEIVCRDIWALHLSLLPNPPPAEPYFYMQEAMGEAVVKEKGSGSDEEHGENSESSSVSEGESEVDDLEPGLESLLRMNSESESSDCSGPSKSKAVVAGKQRERIRGRGRDEYADDGPASTVAVLVVGCWTMRLPMLYMDYIKVIESYELPYLEPLRLLPRELTLHLTKHAAQALSPAHAPGTLTLHALASRLGKKMYVSYGIMTPEANVAPMLWRVIERLGGTPTLYALTKRLCAALSLPLRLHPMLGGELKWVRKGDPGQHKYDNVPPEVGIVCAAVIVLKMVYGLDGEARNPRDGRDPASVLPRSEDYLAYLSRMAEREAKRVERERTAL